MGIYNSLNHILFFKLVSIASYFCMISVVNKYFVILFIHQFKLYLCIFSPATVLILSSINLFILITLCFYRKRTPINFILLIIFVSCFMCV